MTRTEIEQALEVCKGVKTVGDATINSLPFFLTVTPEFSTRLLRGYLKMSDAIEFALHGLDTPMGRKALELAISEVEES